MYLNSTCPYELSHGRGDGPSKLSVMSEITNHKMFYFVLGDWRRLAMSLKIFLRIMEVVCACEYG